MPGPAGLRILQVLEATLGGTARHVIDLCLGMRRLGHEVHLIYNPGEDRLDGLFRNGLPILEAAGVVVAPAAMDRAVGISDLRACRAVRSYIRNRGPFDVIHGHSSKAGLFARIGALGLPGKRIYTPHAFMTANPGLGTGARLLYGAAERFLGGLAHAVICVSDEEKEHALRLGVSGRKLRVIPNGADAPAVPSAALSRSAFGIPQDAIVAGYVGRLVPQKDPGNLLRAFARISGRFPALRLALVGAGPLEDACRGLAQELGIAGMVHWLGVQDGPSAMGLFDIFCLPSRYEGLPYVLIEAMGRGLPIVTTDIGGASNLMEPGGNGFIVPAGDPDALAGAMGALAADPGLRLRMGRRSRDRAGLFTVDRMVESVAALYRSLSLPGTASAP